MESPLQGREIITADHTHHEMGDSLKDIKIIQLVDLEYHDSASHNDVRKDENVEDANDVESPERKFLTKLLIPEESHGVERLQC